MQDLALRGFWLQKWMSSERARECRVMIDYLLGLVCDGKFKYEYVYSNIALFRKFVLWLWLAPIFLLIYQVPIYTSSLIMTISGSLEPIALPLIVGSYFDTH